MNEWIRDHALTVGGALLGALAWVATFAWRASRRLADTESQIAANSAAIASLVQDVREMDGRLDEVKAMAIKIESIEGLITTNAAAIRRIESLLLEGRR